jgi:Spy/CpxP family protein refolding chaperone
VNVTRILGVTALAAGIAGGSLFAQASKGPQAPPAQATAPAKAEPREQGGGRGGMVWWKDAQVVKELSLTPVQVEKINGLYESRNRAMTSASEEHNRILAELDATMKERKAKPSEIEALAKRATYPHFELDVSRTVMLYRMLLVLTPEQHAKFSRLQERRGGGRGMGPGGNPAPR